MFSTRCRCPKKRDGALVNTTQLAQLVSQCWRRRFGSYDRGNGRVIRRWNEALDEELVQRRSAQIEQLLSDPCLDAEGQAGSHNNRLAWRGSECFNDPELVGQLGMVVQLDSQHMTVNRGAIDVARCDHPKSPLVKAGRHNVPKERP